MMLLNMLYLTLWSMTTLTISHEQYVNHFSIPTLVDIHDTKDAVQYLKYTSGIRAIHEDSHGNIWFGSHSEGVCRYDGQDFTYYTMADGLSDHQIRSIYEDQRGNVWMEGGVGVTRYDGTKMQPYDNKNYLYREQWHQGEYDLWFKGDMSTGYSMAEGRPGVYRFDGEYMYYHEFPIPSDQSTAAYYSISTPYVRGLRGRLWFGTYGAVIGFNESILPMMDPVFTVIDDEYLGLNDETGHLHVRSIYEDDQGVLWIGNNGIGVWCYQDGVVTPFSEQQGLIARDSKRSGYKSPPATLEHVFAIGQDAQGNMWFGDRDTGAWRYDGSDMTNYNADHGLTTPHIWQIYLSKSGSLWLAMGDGQVLEFNGSTFERIF